MLPRTPFTLYYIVLNGNDGSSSPSAWLLIKLRRNTSPVLLIPLHLTDVAIGFTTERMLYGF